MKWLNDKWLKECNQVLCVQPIEMEVRHIWQDSKNERETDMRELKEWQPSSKVSVASSR